MIPTIRAYRESDWQTLWPLLRAVIVTGESYAFSPDSSEEEIHLAWIVAPAATYVAIAADGGVLGTYYIKPNQPGLGDHVCNCGYMVRPEAQGRGIASSLYRHSEALAREMGYRAIQFNFVVATNEGAVRLWLKHGFSIVGRLPGAYRHRRFGFVDALIMFKELR